MAAKKKNTGKKDPLQQAAAGMRAERRSRGKTRSGRNTAQAQKAYDTANREYEQARYAKLTDFLTDYWDPDTESFPDLERIGKREIYDPESNTNIENPEFDPETYNKVLAGFGLDPEDLESLGLYTSDVSETGGARRDIASGTNEALDYDYDVAPEDIEGYENLEDGGSGSGITGRAIRETLGEPSGAEGLPKLGRTTTGLEEGASHGRRSQVITAPTAGPRTSGRRTATVPRRLLTRQEVIDRQMRWLEPSDPRTGLPQRPYIQPQVVTPENARGTDLGERSISSIIDTPARRENELRRMVGTFNVLTAQENARLGNAPGSSRSMTTPAQTAPAQTAPAQTAPTAQPTTPQPGRVIRSSRNRQTAGGFIGPLPPSIDPSSSTVNMSDVVGSESTPEAPAQSAGPGRVSINRVPTADTELDVDRPNVSGMSRQFVKFLRSPKTQLAGLIGPGSRSGGALVKGADAVTRRVGGSALGSVVGGWDVDSAGNPVDLDRPDTAVKLNPETGEYELVNPLRMDMDPMDPDYTPMSHIAGIPISAISGPEGEAAVKAAQKARLVQRKIRSMTGRVPPIQTGSSRNPLPGPTVMEESTADIYGPDITEMSRKHRVPPMAVAEVVSGAREGEKLVERNLKPDDVITSGADIDILRARPGSREAVKGQMTRVKLAAGGTGNFRTNIPTDIELIKMFPPSEEGDLDEGGRMTDAYYKRLNTTFLEPKVSVLTPEEMAKRDADRAAADKAEWQARLPKPLSKAEQARDRKLKAKRIEEEEAPRRAYKALREGPNAEPPKGSENKGDFYDTAGFIRAQEDLPYSSTTGYSLSVPQPKPSLDFVSRMLGTDIEQFTADQSLSTGGAMRSVTGDTIKPSSQEGFNAQYKYRSPSGAVSANPTGNPYFKNVNDSQFGGYRSRISDLSTAAPSTGPAPQGPSQEQRMANIREADALVAARRAGSFARQPLEGESLTDMARRVAGPAGPVLRQIGRSMKSQRKAERKSMVSGAQFGQKVEPSTDVG